MELVNQLWSTSLPLALGVCALVVGLLGLSIGSGFAPKASWRQRAGSPLAIAVVGGASLAALLIAIYFNHRAMGAGLVEQIDGVSFLRPPGDADRIPRLIESMSWALALQSAGAIVGLGSGFAVMLSAWSRSLHDPRIRRGSTMAAAAAIATPLVVGAIGSGWLLTRLMNMRGLGTAWELGNEAEAARWAVLGASAGMMLIASPIVVAAAERGILVGRSLYSTSRWILAAGVLAWAGSQLLVEDLHRGPLRQASLEGPQDLTGVPDLARPIALFPPAANCVDQMSSPPSTDRDLLLVVDQFGFAHDPSGTTLTSQTWRTAAEDRLESNPDASGRVLVLVDGRTPAEEVRDYINAAAEIADDVLIVATHIKRHRTLSMGTLHERKECVAAIVDAPVLARDADRWVGTSVRWSSVVERRVRDAEAAASAGSLR